MEPQQGPLEILFLDLQAVAIARLKRGATMAGRQHLGDSRRDQGVGVLGAGDEFGMHHLALAQLRTFIQ